MEHRALGHEIVGSNMPAVPEVTLGGPSSGSYQGVKLEPGLGLGNHELTQRVHCTQVTLNTGNGASTLALKPRGTVNRSPKQRVPVAPQNCDLSPPKKN